MNSHIVNGVQFYTFDSLDRAGVHASVFTRNGGVSAEPWATLNLGGTVGDDPDRVAENRTRAFTAVGRQVSTMFDVWQVHSNNVLCAEHPRPSNEAHQKADAILTNRPDVTLFMRFADCVPILLFDPVHNAIGLVHSGWIGTVNQISMAAIEVMHSQYSSNPSDLLACIGPSICAHHYPIGPDVIDKARQTFGNRVKEVLNESDGRTHFDLWKANQLILQILE